jgi:hypothetical protein
MLRKRMTARIEVLDPIDSRAYPSVDALRQAAHTAVTEALPEANRPAESARAAGQAG